MSYYTQVHRYDFFFWLFSPIQFFLPSSEKIFRFIFPSDSPFLAKSRSSEKDDWPWHDSPYIQKLLWPRGAHTSQFRVSTKRSLEHLCWQDGKFPRKKIDSSFFSDRMASSTCCLLLPFTLSSPSGRFSSRTPQEQIQNHKFHRLCRIFIASSSYQFIRTGESLLSRCLFVIVRWHDWNERYLDLFEVCIFFLPPTLFTRVEIQVLTPFSRKKDPPPTFIFVAAPEMKKFSVALLKSMKKSKASTSHISSWFPHLIAALGYLQSQLLSPIILFNPPPIYYDYHK